MEALGPQKPLHLTTRDEEILASVYHYRYVTSLDIAHLLFRPSYMPYVRSRLARLSGGKDLDENRFLCRFKLPSTEERIFTLGTLGRKFLETEKGQAVDWFFRPGKMKFISYAASLHHLLLSRFLVACQWWCRGRDDMSLLEERISYELARVAPTVTLTEQKKALPLTIIPDAWVLFEKENRKYAVIFELDRGMEHQAQFKRHIKGLIELIRSGQYAKIFGVPGVIVSYVTTGQTPQYRNTRVKTMNAWTRGVLSEMNLMSWAGIFRCTAVEYAHLYKTAGHLFEDAVWLRPDAATPVRLFD